MTPPRRPHPDGAKCAFYLLFIQKFRPPFQRWRGRGAVRQRKFGFQTKLPGRKRPSSGDFSGFQPEARFARRPLSLPYGRGVGDPSPQAPPFRAGCRFFPKPKFYSIFSKKSRFPKAEPLVAHRNERNTLSCEAHFWGELPRSGKRGLFASEKAPLHIRTRIHNHLISSERVFCRPAALKNLAIHKVLSAFFRLAGQQNPSPIRHPLIMNTGSNNPASET